MEHEELTHKIIGCAYTVYKKLGFGFLESVYRKSMVIELIRADLKVEEEKPLKVYYYGQVVGSFSADLVVEESIVIELKSVQNLVKEHEVQLVNYLNAIEEEIATVKKDGVTEAEMEKARAQFRRQADCVGLISSGN